MFRIYPFSYHPRTVCLRLELKGCRLQNDNGIQKLLKIFQLKINLCFTESILLHSSEVHSVSVNNNNEYLVEEDWTETIFLAVAIGIMTVVIIVTIAAIVYVMASNWKLKYYTTFYTNNIDTNSSLESSLKR